MKRLAWLFLILSCACGYAGEPGVLEQSVINGMGMIDSGKIPDAMNEIRLGFNSNRYDQRKPSADCIDKLDAKISREEGKKKKAALLVYRAVVLLANGPADGIDKAILALNEAEQLDPELPEVYNTRGGCYLFQKNTDLALKDFDKAILLNENYVDAIANRAATYWHVEQKDKAVADMVRYQRLLGKLYYPEKPH